MFAFLLFVFMLSVHVPEKLYIILIAETIVDALALLYYFHSFGHVLSSFIISIINLNFLHDLFCTFLWFCICRMLVFPLTKAIPSHLLELKLVLAFQIFKQSQCLVLDIFYPCLAFSLGPINRHV